MRLDRSRSARRSNLIRLALLCLAGVVGIGAVVLSPSLASTTAFPSALAAPTCGPGALKETDIDGRVPSADYTSGRYKQGYRCNTEQVSHQGATGGFKVERYVDAAGHVCAFYDSTLLFPKDTLMQAVTGLGRRRPRHDRPGQAGEDGPADHPGHAEPPRVAAAEHRAGPARRRAGQPGHQRLDPRPLRREVRLPAPEAAVEHPHRRLRPRERLRPRRPHLLHHRHGRATPCRPSTSATRRSRRCCSRSTA